MITNINEINSGFADTAISQEHTHVIRMPRLELSVHSPFNSVRTEVALTTCLSHLARC